MEEFKKGDVVQISLLIDELYHKQEAGIIVDMEIYQNEGFFPIKLLEIYTSNYGTVKIDACYVATI
jgi:hypothetical protein